MRKRSLIIAALLGVISGSAMAADLGPAPIYKAQPAPEVFYWSGCYVGVEGGYAWGRTKDTAVTGANPGRDINSGFNLNGGIAGGTLGCNYQTANLVLGLETDLSWTDKKGQAFDIPPFGAGAFSQRSESWIDTVRARGGFAWNRTYLYGTAGAAGAKIGITVCTADSFCVSDSATKWGWTVGGGIEWAFWANWSFRAEYLHADFGTIKFINPSVVSPAGNTIVTRNVPVTDDLFRVGLNYRLGWGGPVVARY